MKCPLCKVNTRVINSRTKEDVVARRRECPECLSRFTTSETIDQSSITEYLRKKINRERGFFFSEEDFLRESQK